MTAQPAKSPVRSADRRHRRYPRYRCQFPLTATLFSGQEHQVIEGHCRDLSEGGLGALIASELTAGEVASLSFLLPGNPTPWTVRAVLRHRRGYHYGFEFLSLSGGEMEALLAYLPGLQRMDFDLGEAPPDGNARRVT